MKANSIEIFVCDHMVHIAQPDVDAQAFVVITPDQAQQVCDWIMQAANAVNPLVE